MRSLILRIKGSADGAGISGDMARSRFTGRRGRGDSFSAVNNENILQVFKGTE